MSEELRFYCEVMEQKEREESEHRQTQEIERTISAKSNKQASETND